jgi:hypothetical protein
MHPSDRFLRQLGPTRRPLVPAHRFATRRVYGLVAAAPTGFAQCQQ